MLNAIFVLSFMLVDIFFFLGGAGKLIFYT